MKIHIETLDFIRKIYKSKPTIAIILGTGLGGLVNEIEVELEIPYQQIPNFPLSTVETHVGKLVFGKLGGKNIVAMQGRFHYYEGYTMEQITFPVRIMRLLGATSIFISNASGGINPDYRKGDLMILEDHINLQSGNPLIGPNLDQFGPRFPDMSEPYSRRLIQLCKNMAIESNIPVHTGVYVAVNGPNLETRAEYRFLGRIGADAVGMSTVPEVIVANHMGMQVFAISLITDECDPDNLSPVSIEEIIEVAAVSEPKLTILLEKMAKAL